MKSLIRVFIMEFQRIAGNKAFIFLVVAWPLLYSILFGGILWKRVVQKMPVAVVDLDRSSLSRTLVRYISASRSFDVVRTLENPLEIKDDFLTGDRAMTLVIPRNFSRDIKRGSPVVLKAFSNAANIIVGGLTYADLKTITATFAGGIQLKTLQKGGLSTQRALEIVQPIQVDVANLFNPGMNYQNYLTPGLWAMLIQQMMLLLGALCFVPFRERKEVQSLRGQAGSDASLFWGKYLFYLVVGVASFELILRLLFPFFGIEINAPVFTIISLVFLFCAGALALGFVISLASDTTFGAMKGVLLISSPAFLLSGYTFPLDYMPYLHRALSAVFPLSPFVTAYRRLFQEGIGLEYLEGPIVHLLILLVIYLSAAVLLYRQRWRTSP